MSKDAFERSRLLLNSKGCLGCDGGLCSDAFILLGSPIYTDARGPPHSQRLRWFFLLPYRTPQQSSSLLAALWPLDELALDSHCSREQQSEWVRGQAPIRTVITRAEESLCMMFLHLPTPTHQTHWSPVDHTGAKRGAEEESRSRSPSPPIREVRVCSSKSKTKSKVAEEKVTNMATKRAKTNWISFMDIIWQQ